MEEFEEVNDQKQSKINSGLLITLRLDALWKDCNRHARTGQYAKWNADLDRVWCELVGDIDEKTDKESLDKYENINFLIAKDGVLMNGSLYSGFNKITKEQLLITTKQYKSLMIKEAFLRRLQNKQGKGTAYDRGEDDYMD